MLRRLHVQNFMSLRDTTIELSPLTILIGPNASGKSAIFKCLTALGKLLGRFAVRGWKGEFTLDPAVNLDYLVWQGNSGLPIIFRVWFSENEEDEPDYTLELRKEATGWSVSRERLRMEDGWFDSSKQSFQHETESKGTKVWRAPYRATLSHLVYPFRNDDKAAPVIKPFLDLSARFGEFWRYRPSANDIASFAQVKSEEAADRFYVREDGWGLPLALQRLQGNDRPRFKAIEDELRRLFPHIRYIAFETERFGVRLAFSSERSEDLVPAPEESDGVLLTTFLLWRLYTGQPNMTVCLEEPETGVHPYLLHERLKILRQFAMGEAPHRPPVQLLAATHSPDFLNAVGEGTDAPSMMEMVRLVEHDSEHGTKVHRLGDLSEVEALMSVFSGNLGEMWWSGAIGAVPPIGESGSEV